jgi:hypothetical protein
LPQGNNPHILVRIRNQPDFASADLFVDTKILSADGLFTLLKIETIYTYK